jgi:hypothetical protein
MGEIRQPQHVLPILAAFSRYESALAWAHQRAAQQWGEVVLASDPIPFVDTHYYAAEMGAGLQKCFWAFQRLIDPADLPLLKQHSNGWEAEYRNSHLHSEARPLNLDPGYLTEAKLVLATTKDRDHRIYLSGGIYAEITLYYCGGQWRHREWTYPDYRQPVYHEFFDRCREYYRHRLGKTKNIPWPD